MLRFKENRFRLLEFQQAFQEDCETLLTKFEKLNSYSFHIFENIWQEMSFSLIFLGKYRKNELPQFIQLCLNCIKKYIVFDTSNYMKVGALYLLYGVFNKQPIKHYVRLRLVLSEFKILSGFVASMRAENHLEPCYVYSKLLEDNAFDFVFSQCAVGLDTKVIKADLNLIDDIFLSDREIKEDLETVDKEIFGELEDVDSKYQKLLKQYLSDNPNVKFTPYSVTLKDVFEDCPVSNTVDDELALKRKSIKDKAFSSTSRK